MKNNFANWELTQLLPNNPYENDYCWWDIVPHYYNISTKKFTETKSYIHFGYKFNKYDRYYFSDKTKKIKDAWTWEDIRKYLLSKGIKIEDNNLDDYSLDGFTNFLIYVKYENKPKIELVKTFEKTNYEQGRLQAIEYALNLIEL